MISDAQFCELYRRVDELCRDVAGIIARMDSRCAAHQNDIARCRSAIDGNGRPGLQDRVARIEAMARIAIVIIGPIGAMIGAVTTYLLT